MIVIRRSQLLLTNKKENPSVTSRQTGSRLSLKYQEEAVFVGYKQQQKEEQQKSDDRVFAISREPDRFESSF